MSNELNIPAFANLSEEEKKLAFEILKQYSQNGTSAILDDLKYSDFEEVPVDIDTFLDNDYYLGKGLWVVDEFTGERKCTVFPYWRETLKKLFPDNITTAYNTLILTGAIGIGKSFVGVLAMLYLLYRMLCLKDPYGYFGMQPIDKITFSMLNITLDAAQGVAWDKAQQMLQSSEWFMSHGQLNASRSNPQWQPPKGIELIFGSNNRHIVGRALFCLDGDTEILTTTGVKKIKQLVDKDIRVVSIDDNGYRCISEACTAKPTILTTEEYQIELADGTLIKCTADHRLRLIDGTYKEAKNLTEADELMEIQVSCLEYIDNISRTRSQWSLQSEYEGHHIIPGCLGGNGNTKTKHANVIKSIKKIMLPEAKQYYDIIDAAPYNNFLIKTNSSYIVSHNCNMTDEVNFGVGNNVEKQKEKQRKMIAQIDARMRSRFLRGTYLPTLNIIISSKDTEQAFLNSYINLKKQNESKTSLIVDEPQWVVDRRKGSPDDPGAFYVAIGNKFLAHELLPTNTDEKLIDSYREKGYTMLKVPPGYRETFEDNLDQALMDIAGFSTSSATKYISGIRLNQAKTETYTNPFVKDVIEVGNSPDDHLQYANFFDISRINPKDITRPLFIHLDMSMSGDKTGIAGVWITGKRPTQNGEDSSRELQYKLAFSVSIKAPKGFQVSFAKNRNFIRWLRDQGFAIKGISSDTFQSAQIQQDLKADGFNTKIVSVDRIDHETRICLPYQYLKSAIYERRIEIYKKCDLLTDELVGLERKGDGHIDHTPEGINSKDQADAVCGSLFLASQFAEEYSYSYGDNLEVSLDINGLVDDSHLKTRMIADFEAELAKVYMETDAVAEAEMRKKRQEYQQYQDILDGIIIL